MSKFYVSKKHRVVQEMNFDGTGTVLVGVESDWQIEHLFKEESFLEIKSMKVIGSHAYVEIEHAGSYRWDNFHFHNEDKTFVEDYSMSSPLGVLFNN